MATTKAVGSGHDARTSDLAEQGGDWPLRLAQQSRSWPCLPRHAPLPCITHCFYNAYAEL